MEPSTLWPREKTLLYPLLLERAAALLAGETDAVANMANLSALVWQALPDLNHIPCDGASRSELVIPLFAPDGEVTGVLDLDSPLLGRFDRQDLEGLLPVSRLIIMEVEG